MEFVVVADELDCLVQVLGKVGQVVVPERLEMDQESQRVFVGAFVRICLLFRFYRIRRHFTENEVFELFSEQRMTEVCNLHHRISQTFFGFL